MSRLPVLLLLFLCANLANAQTLAVRTLALGSDELPEVFVRGEKDFQPLPFSSVQPGEVVPALRADPLPLYQRGTNEKGEEGFVVAQQVKVPSNAKGILLLGWKSGDEVRYLAIEDDFGSARFNDWLLINTCKQGIAFKVGEESKAIMLAPGKSTTHRVSAQEGKGATVHAGAAVDGEIKLFFSTFWPVHPGKRAVVLFVDDGTKIRVKRISDALPPPPVPKP